MTNNFPIDTEDVRAMVYRGLTDNGLWPDWASFEAGRALTVQWGESHVAELRRSIGDRTWRSGFREFAVPVAEIDLVRILGFGRLLTEFAIAPLGIPVAFRQPIAQLGALANLIVALYDHCLDGSADGRVIVPRRALQASRLLPTRRAFSWRRFIGAPDQRLMIRLVHMFYAQLEYLARRAPTGNVVRPIIHRAILRMYDAESLTAPSCGPPQVSTLRRKAALPFVVMGLPGRLAAPVDLERDRWHLRWLYRLGMYFGAIDDVVDFETDRRKAVPNSLGADLSRTDANVALIHTTQKLVNHGKYVVESWHRHAALGALGALTHPAIAQALEITTCSWFGGIGWQPREELRFRHAVH